MSYLRGKTQKAKKFGTPTTPSVSTPKGPSPRATGGTPTVTAASKAVSKPTTTRRVLTQREAGQIAQETFRTQVQSLTASLRNQRTDIAKQLQGGLHPQTRLNIVEKIAGIDAEIAQIETEQHEAVLATNINQIIQAIKSGQVVAPDYFQNNITWVKTGAITQQAFLDAYYYLSTEGIIHAPIPEPVIEEVIEPEPEPTVLLSANIKISFTDPNIGGFSSSIPIGDIGELQGLSNASNEWKYTLIGSSTIQPISTLSELIKNINDLLATVPPEPDSSITDNMVTQQVINFNIVNGRAVGSIKFVATNNFNPYYYGHNIVNIIQFKDPNGANILTFVKQNPLHFTETERDEIISYDEDMKGNTRATVESFVLSSATAPTAFSKMGSWDISEAEPPKPLTTGFMSAGVAGAIAGLVLLGFIADHKRGK
jgi:hypothetical protein